MIKSFLKISFLAGLVFFSLASCNKEDNTGNNNNGNGAGDGNGNPQGIRLKSISYGNEELYTITYDGEKVKEIIGKEDNDEFKIEVSYAGNKIILRNWEKQGGTWVQGDYSTERTVENGLITQQIEFGAGVVDYKEVYVYSGTKMTRRTSFENSSIGLEEYYKSEYTYQSDKIKEILSSSKNSQVWRLSDKEVFTHGSDGLGLVESSYDNGVTWSNGYKSEYTYAGGKVSRIEEYDWNADNISWEKEGHSDYEYNADGSLKKTTYDDGDIFTFGYETGVGNLKVIFGYPSSSLYARPDGNFYKNQEKNHFQVLREKLAAISKFL